MLRERGSESNMAKGIEKSRGQLQAVARYGDVTPVASNRIPVHSSRFKWQITYARYLCYVYYKGVDAK